MDPRTALALAEDEYRRRVALVRPEHLESPSRRPGGSVYELVTHLAGGGHRRVPWRPRPSRRDGPQGMRRSTMAIACAMALAALTPAIGPAIAAATPSSGVTAEVIGAVTVPAVATVTLRHIAIDPGGATGWHYHQGPVYALITAGTLTRTLQDCTVVDSAAGQVVEEAHGAEHPHVGANDGVIPVELWTVYVEPVGAPLSDDAPAVDCP